MITLVAQYGKFTGRGGRGYSCLGRGTGRRGGHIGSWSYMQTRWLTRRQVDHYTC